MVSATYSHPAIKIGDAKDIDMNGQTIVGAGLELPHTVRKVASANLKHSHDAEVSSAVFTWTEVKRITFPNGLLGSHRFSLELKCSNPPHAGYARLTKNGVGVGFSTLQSDVTGAYVTKTEDITSDFNPGDYLGLVVVPGVEGETVYVRNLRISYDDSPTIAVASTNS